MKLPAPLEVLDEGLAVGDFAISVRPALSTSAPALRPDLGPSADNHDAGLDQAAVGPHVPAPTSCPSAGEQRSAEELEAALTTARARQVLDEQLVQLTHDPLLDLPPV